MSEMLAGKKGIILGVANERSIAWGIAKVLAEQGADLAFTYQTDGFGKRVLPLAESVNAKIVVPVDVQNEASINHLYNEVQKKWGKIDFFVHAIAYSDKEELTGRFINSSKRNFLNSLDISCYSLIQLSRVFSPLMFDGGTILTLSYMGSQRVTPNYNIMGVAKAALESTVRYLSNDLGLQKIRVNSISPGPMKTLAGAAIGGARQVFRTAEANSPLRSNATLNAVGGTALYLISDYGRFTTGENIFVDGGYHVMGMPRIESL